MSKKLPPIPQGERVHKVVIKSDPKMTRFVIEDTLRGYRYRAVMYDNKLRYLEAGCRQWKSFKKAKDHYAPGWQERQRYVPWSNDNGTDRALWETKRLRALQRIARLEFEVKRYRANLRAAWLGKKPKKKVKRK